MRHFLFNALKSLASSGCKTVALIGQKGSGRFQGRTTMTNQLKMADLIDAYAVSRGSDETINGRLMFFREQLGELAVTDVKPDDVDAAITELARRGKHRVIRGKGAIPTGQPLSGATLNRAVNLLGGVFKFARQHRLVPRNFVSPTRGYEKSPEPIDPERYIKADEVERLIIAARAIDRRWQRLPALLRLAYTTGLRKSNLLNLRWKDIDLANRTVTVNRTKNGRPHVSPLAASAAEELMKLSGRNDPNALIFGNDAGKPFHYGRLLEKSAAMAGQSRYGLHLLRHGFGTALALSGVPQATISTMLAHKDIGSSYRYIHHSVRDKIDVVDRVFG
jgi:integrase